MVAVFLAIWWLIGAWVLTFNWNHDRSSYDPRSGYSSMWVFRSTSNAFFSTWIATFLSLYWGLEAAGLR